MPLERGTSSGHSPLLSEQLWLESSTPAGLSNSFFIHNTAPDLKNASVEATALGARTPLSYCASSELGEEMCLTFCGDIQVYLVSWDLDSLGDEETTERL